MYIYLYKIKYKDGVKILTEFDLYLTLTYFAIVLHNVYLVVIHIIHIDFIFLTLIIHPNIDLSIFINQIL